MDQLKRYKGVRYLGRSTSPTTRRRRHRSSPRPCPPIPTSLGVFATNTQGAIGAVTGLKQTKAAKRVKLIAYDAATAEVNALKNGTISALIAQNPTQEGQVTVQLASKLMKGRRCRRPSSLSSSSPF